MLRAAGLLLILTASAFATDLHNLNRGPYGVRVAESVTLDVRGTGPLMSVRAVYPTADGPWPLVVFSHGMFSSNTRYEPIVEHWASHGYAVLLPNHLDADRGIKIRQNSEVEALIRSRAQDLVLVLDALPDIEAAVPALAGSIRPPPYVAAGHSVGTYVALLVAGLETRNPQTGDIMRRADSRFGAVVMSSDPGNMALMPGDLWLGAAVPSFLVRGTADFGLMGDGRTPTEYENEVISDRNEAAGHKYLLIIDGADHYFGGLVHRRPDGAQADPEGLAIFNALSTTFLAGYTRGDTVALERLREVDVSAATNGRARLSIR